MFRSIVLNALPRSCVAATACLLLAACATPGGEGQDSAATPASTPAQASNQAVAASGASLNPDEIVCVKEKITGSRLRRTVCQTRAEWAAMRGGAQETMRELQALPQGIDDQ